MIARAGGIDERCHAGRLDLVKLGLLRRAEARACSARGIGMRHRQTSSPWVQGGVGVHGSQLVAHAEQLALPIGRGYSLLA